MKFKIVLYNIISNDTILRNKKNTREYKREK